MVWVKTSLRSGPIAGAVVACHRERAVVVQPHGPSAFRHASAFTTYDEDALGMFRHIQGVVPRVNVESSDGFAKPSAVLHLRRVFQSQPLALAAVSRLAFWPPTPVMLGPI